MNLHSVYVDNVGRIQQKDGSIIWATWYVADDKVSCKIYKGTEKKKRWENIDNLQVTF